MTRTEKLLGELIALPSVNPAFAAPEAASTRPVRQVYGESRVADFLASKMAKSGLEIDFQKVFQDRSNIFARLLPKNKIKRTILLAPHMDTVDAVDAMFTPRRKNGRLVGRGTCDTKGSVAAMVTAICELAESKSRPQETQIIFAGLVDEEYAQAGSRALVAQASRLCVPTNGRDARATTFAIVGEPTKLQIVTAHKGSLWLNLETRGKAAHGATPHLGKNAVHEMARVVDMLETTYAAQLRRRKHKLLGTGTVNVGQISGGTQPNIVPASCTISVDRRTLPGETEVAVCREISSQLRARGLSAKVSNAKLAPAPAMETDFDLPLVRQFFSIVGQTRPAGVDYFCDAAVLAMGGIPSVVFGPGNIAQAHTVDEWISLAELECAKELLLHFLKSLS